MWRFIAPTFEHQYTTIVFDWVGSGFSDISYYETANYSTLEGYAIDLIEILKSINREDTVIVGHSVSSVIGMLAAISNPELVGRLVMLAPSPCYINHPGYKGGFEQNEIENLISNLEQDFESWSGNITQVIIGQGNNQDFIDELNSSFCRTNRLVAKQFAKATFYSDYRNSLPYLKTQTLILQVENDLIAPVEVGEYMHKKIPDSVLMVVKTVGHCPHLTAPTKTISAIKQFLNNS
jgi:sigma-B regulation protein RsbQ